MWYWAIGQAEFGEQIQAYGDILWRQVGSPLLWTLAVLWVGLALTALVIFMYGKSAARKSTLGMGPSGTVEPGRGSAKAA